MFAPINGVLNKRLRLYPKPDQGNACVGNIYLWIKPFITPLFNFINMKKIKLLVILLLLNHLGFSQTNISGFIFDEYDNPIDGAQIIVKSQSEGSAAKNDFFSLKDGSFYVRLNLPVTIQVLANGYINYEVSVTDSSTLRIQLVPISGYKNIKPLTLSSVRQSSLESNQSKLSKPEINKQNGITDIPDLLKMQPSIVTTSDAGNNVGYAGIRLRGTDATRINITINGIPVNDAEGQGVWWVNIPDLTSSLNSIQITRGLGGSSNGAASFGGTVSLETDDPFNGSNKVDLAYGSFNTYRTSASANSGNISARKDGNAPGFAIGMRVSNIHSDGYIDRGSSDLQSYMINLGYGYKNSKLRFIHFAGKEKTYQAWYGLDETLLKTNRKFNAAGLYTDKNGDTRFYDNQTDNYSQAHSQLFYDHQILNQANLKIKGSLGLHYTKGQGYYEEYKENQMLSNYNVTDTNTSNLVRQLWLLNDFMGTVYNLSVHTKKYNVIFGGAFNTYMGNHFGKIVSADFGTNIPENFRYYDSDARKNEWSNFVKLNRSFSLNRAMVNLFADAQIRAINYSALGRDDHQTPINFNQNYLFFNPKLGGTATVRKNYISRQISLFLGMGNREPARGDFLNGGTSPKPEKLYNLELGYAMTHKKWAAMANYYMMYYHDQLVLTGELDDVGASIRANVKESYRTGIELVGQYSFTSKLTIDANLTLSQNKITQWQETVYDYDTYEDSVIIRNDKPIAYSPSIIAGLTLSYKINAKTEILIQNKSVGRQFLDNTGIKEKSLNGYNFTNVIITRQINLARGADANFPLGFSLYLNNITNTLYENNGYAYSFLSKGDYLNAKVVYPQAGFNLGLKVSLIF